MPSLEAQRRYIITNTLFIQDSYAVEGLEINASYRRVHNDEDHKCCCNGLNFELIEIAADCSHDCPEDR